MSSDNGISGTQHNDDMDPEESHFSDEDLECALAGFEQEFAQQESDGDNTSAAGDEDAQDPISGFDDELEGLLGNKAKAAVMVTRLASDELLAAFCQLSDISADCLASEQGAVAVLHNLDGDGPEAAIKDLTTVVSGLSAVLVVNRADKLEATLYVQGQSGDSLSPPIVFASAPNFVEDVMLGLASVDMLKQQGIHSSNSADLTRDDAMAVIARHMRFGREGKTPRD